VEVGQKAWLPVVKELETRQQGHKADKSAAGAEHSLPLFMLEECLLIFSKRTAAASGEHVLIIL
jgi:hypothetical protein